MSDSVASHFTSRTRAQKRRGRPTLIAASVGAVLAAGLVTAPAHAVNNTTTYDVYLACSGTTDADLVLNRVGLAETNPPSGEAVIVNLHVPAAKACVVNLADSTVMDGPNPVKFLDLGAGRDITINGIADLDSSLTLLADPTSTNAAVMVGSAGHTVTLSNLTLAGVGASATAAAPLVLVTGSGASLVIDHATLKDNRLSATATEAAAIDAMTMGDTTVTLDHATVTGNRGGVFGAIAISSTNDTTVTDSLFEHNMALKASSGGGAINVSTESGTPTLTITGSTFNDNQADSYGGAVSSSAVAVQVDSSTFHANLVPTGSGGAIYAESATVDVANGSAFTDNQADANGGAIADPSGTVTVNGSSFTGNSATTSRGGAVFSGDSLTIDSTTFDSNTAGTIGGAAYMDNFMTDRMQVSRSEFTDNTAGNGGGALYDSMGLATSYVDASTFAGNAGGTWGGAISMDGYGVVSRSTFVGNTGTHGAGVLSSGLVTTSTFVGNTTTAGGFVVENQAGGGVFGSIIANDDSGTQGATNNTDLGANLVTKLPASGWALTAGETANHSREVTFAALKLGSLALNTTGPDNTGPTRTVALGAGSVAIDFYTLNPITPTAVTVDGDAAYVQDTDQRNVDRPNNGAIDVGAYEYYPVVTCTTTTLGVINFRVDSFELTPAAQKKLRAFARKIEAAGCQSITLNGHTSGRGSSTAMERVRTKLATNRNAVVRRYLRQQLAAHGVTVTFYNHVFNANSPLASNYGPKAAINRRVQVVMSTL